MVFKDWYGFIREFGGMNLIADYHLINRTPGFAPTATASVVTRYWPKATYRWCGTSPATAFARRMRRKSLG